MRVNRELAESTRTRDRMLERLASGTRIVSSADDAAGLSISEKLKGSIRSLHMAQRNTLDGVSILQTAEGGMNEAQNILVRLRELSVQAASDTIGEDERRYTNLEFQNLKQEIQRVANTTMYNHRPLLNGTRNEIDVQVDIDHDDASRVSFLSGVTNMLPSALGITELDISTKQGAQSGLAALDGAISRVSGNRAYIGGVQRELQEHIQTLDVHRTSLSEGNSRIRDADYAEWTAREASERIRQESANAMLVHANSNPQAAVRLLEKA